ncbi:hypothetical protein [Vibrio sp. SCSIO 43169]|uniref:hypothetical protein n=1 Tax=Vibrio sp. SCSIO 43169 TaxID=2822801 RepID=UPI00204373C0|nr:hypothetical protein [Vibrio sp. SCSIO 43169]MCM5507151.1 hypothetical protein [Vibrio sp. SCSIO 43169]
MTKAKNPNSDQIGIRNLDLRLRVERLATLDDRKMTQMAALLLRKAVELKEEELGLPPIGEQAA